MAEEKIITLVEYYSQKESSYLKTYSVKLKARYQDLLFDFNVGIITPNEIHLAETICHQHLDAINLVLDRRAGKKSDGRITPRRKGERDAK